MLPGAPPPGQDLEAFLAVCPPMEGCRALTAAAEAAAGVKPSSASRPPPFPIQDPPPPPCRLHHWSTWPLENHDTGTF